MKEAHAIAYRENKYGDSVRTLLHHPVLIPILLWNNSIELVEKWIIATDKVFGKMYKKANKVQRMSYWKYFRNAPYTSGILKFTTKSAKRLMMANIRISIQNALMSARSKRGRFVWRFNSAVHALSINKHIFSFRPKP